MKLLEPRIRKDVVVETGEWLHPRMPPALLCSAEYARAYTYRVVGLRMKLGVNKKKAALAVFACFGAPQQLERIEDEVQDTVA